MLAITLLRRLLLHRRDSAAARHEESGGHTVTLAEEDDALRALDANDRAIVAREHLRVRHDLCDRAARIGHVALRIEMQPVRVLRAPKVR